MDEKYCYRTRTLELFFRKAAGQFPVLLVTGPRQVGKTTFLRHLAGEKRHYVTLDAPLIRTLAKEDPSLVSLAPEQLPLTGEVEAVPVGML